MKNTLKNKWSIFGGVILSPGSVLFILLTGGGLILSYVFKSNALFSTLLGILSTISGGIAGSFIRDDYTKLTTDNILEKKGRSAIRNLRSIGKQITHVREWIIEFGKGRINKEQKRTLDEIDRHLSTAQMNIESGFEDWVDIVPELAEAAEITKRQEEVIQAYLEERLKSIKELVMSKDEKRTAELKERISDLERQIKRVRNTPTPWVGMASGYGGSIVGPSGFGYGGTIPTVGMATIGNCEKCGKPFSRNGVQEAVCPTCRLEDGGVSVVANTL